MIDYRRKLEDLVGIVERCLAENESYGSVSKPTLLSMQGEVLSINELLSSEQGVQAGRAEDATIIKTDLCEKCDKLRILGVEETPAP